MESGSERSEYVLTPDTESLDETVEEALDGTLGEQLVQVIQADDPDGSGAIRPFLVIDLRRALQTVREIDTPVPGIDQAAEAASELAGDDDNQSKSSSQSESEQEPSGRGLLSKLFVLGVVVGIGYALRKRRSGRSVDEAAEEAAEETQTIAERAASTVQRRGEVAASRIEEGTGAIAERIEETGEESAQQIQESGEQIDEVESRAEEKIEDGTSETRRKNDGE